jgi:predicted HTH domain antitoxin
MGSEKSNKMKTLTLDMPDSVDFDDKEATMAIAARLFEKGKLSLGQAAKLAGLSKSDFMEALSDYNVSIFNYPPDNLTSDLRNAESYSL